MTIDEAIKFCEEKSENIKLKTEPETFVEIARHLKENRALKNRCYILTNGTMCLFCPIDCSRRKEMFIGEE